MVREGEAEPGLTGTPIWDRKMQIQWRYREVVKAIVARAIGDGNRRADCGADAGR